MDDILTLCKSYKIDLAQFLLTPDGKHPVIITEEEYERLKQTCTERKDETDDYDYGESSEQELSIPETYISNNNAADMLRIISESGKKIAALYERIAELAADNARMKSILSRYDMETGFRKTMIADGEDD